MWEKESGVVGLILLLFLRFASDLLAVGGLWSCRPGPFGSAGSLERPTNSETRLLDVELYFFIWEGVFFLTFREEDGFLKDFSVL